MTVGARKVTFGTSPKYHNKPTTCVIAGQVVSFDSIREAKAYADLKMRELAGRVRKIERQVRFNIPVKEKIVCFYRADFVFEEYEHGVWKVVIADAKGFATPVYKLKKKLMLAALGIEIREL